MLKTYTTRIPNESNRFDLKSTQIRHSVRKKVEKKMKGSWQSLDKIATNNTMMNCHQHYLKKKKQFLFFDAPKKGGSMDRQKKKNYI